LKKQKVRDGKLSKTRAKPAGDLASMNSIDLIRDESVEMRLRLRVACNMLTDNDGRALSFVKAVAKTGTIEQRIRAASALTRYARRASIKKEKAVKNPRDPMQSWYDRVDKLSDAERENFTPDRLKSWLKELHEGGVARREHSRKWTDIGLQQPQIIRDYVASMEEADRDRG
jgi:hypothetical protein